MSPFSIWKCWDPQTLHRLVLLQATAGPLRAAPTNLNLPGASIAEDPAPPSTLSPSLSWFWVKLGESCPPLPHTVDTSVVPKTCIGGILLNFANDTVTTFQDEK